MCPPFLIAEAWTTPTGTAWTHPSVFSCANPTWREHTWGGILNSESAASLHICVPCKLTKQEQSKQGECAEESHPPLGGGAWCVAVTDGSVSIMSKGQVHRCGPDVVA